MKRLANLDRRSAGEGNVRLAGAGLLAAVLGILLVPWAADAQQPTYRAGQPVHPAFEGWIEKEDGSRAFLFGYMNENWEEELDVPVGPENYFAVVENGELDDLEVDAYEGATADRGQPTHFLPRRNRFVFEVPVPEGLEEGEELVWTLETKGQTKRAYATLEPDFYVDNVVIMSETGALGPGSSDPELRANERPDVELQVQRELTARVGEPVRLVAKVTDDGVPERDRRARRPVNEDGELVLERATAQQMKTGFITVEKMNGLHFSWFPYRGPRAMTFNPPQIKVWEDTRSFANSPWSFPHWVPPELPEDDRWVAEVTFDEPGTYVLRGRADDGGLYRDVQVTVHVRAADAAP